MSAGSPIARLGKLLFALPLLDVGGDECATAGELTPAERLVASQRVLVIAHRGDSRKAPENTLPAFASALRAGADLVELDYYHSADGAPVVFHDKELDRTTDATLVFGREKIPVHSKTLDELRRLDAGAWFGRRFAGAKIPTLDESLDLIQTGSTTLIERKDGQAATCVELLRRKCLLDRVVVQSFDWEYLRECHRLAPQLTLAALGDKELTQRLDQVEATGARIVAWSEKEYGKRDCDAIHRRNWKAWVYTVDDPARAVQLLDAGVDGLITNVPATMRETIRAWKRKR